MIIVECALYKLFLRVKGCKELPDKMLKITAGELGIYISYRSDARIRKYENAGAT